jgi:hypothetical protein
MLGGFTSAPVMTSIGKLMLSIASAAVMAQMLG